MDDTSDSGRSSGWSWTYKWKCRGSVEGPSPLETDVGLGKGFKEKEGRSPSN